MQKLPQEALGIAPADLGSILDRPLDVVERVLLLRTTSELRQANVDALAVVARQMEEVRAPPGKTFWNVGDPAEHVLYLLAGTVVCRTADGRAFRYGPGTGAGGVEALAKQSRWYSVTAETAVIGLLGRSAHLVDVFESHLRMAMDFIMMLARAEIGLLARRAALGQSPLVAPRDLTRLGGIRVGA